jgi:cytochrome o ubiquinol oxidase operon protein cyoD
MPEDDSVVYAHHDTDHGSVGTYVTGFLLSIIFTLVAYVSVMHHWLMGNWLVVLLLALAIVQFSVQLIFFLHVGRETKPRWKRLMLVLMIVFVMIVVLGSIWVMYSLNYHMSPQKIETYLKTQDGGI